MCGRYTLTRGQREVAERFSVQESLPIEFEPRYNIAPTQTVPVIVSEGERWLQNFRWGLIPFWAKDASIGARMINARAETLSEKPAFRKLFEKRRCLVPSDGFYEWAKTGHGKIPVRIQMATKDLFCFAGLWDCWRSPDGAELRSFTIITTAANELLRPVHDRMPVILQERDFDLWLNPTEKRKESLQPLMRSFGSEEMVYYSVSTLVNSPRNDDPKCTEPVVGSERDTLGEITDV